MKRLFSLLVLILFVVAACGGPPPTPLPFTAMPWGDGDREEYVIRENKDGRESGTAFFAVTMQGDTFVIEQMSRLDTLSHETSVVVNAADLKPIRGRRTVTGTPNDFSLTSEYSSGKLTIKAETKQGPKSATVDVPAAGYDNDESLMMQRALPLADGYTARYIDVITANASQIEIALKVVGRENLDVPAGSFDCFKVELVASGIKQFVWYSTDASHYMVKYDNGTRSYLLKSISSLK
jgi:hypothetical protein